MKLSIVITVFNEEDNALILLHQLQSSLKDIEYEIIFVDDGSTDSTVSKLTTISHPNVKIIELTKNYGQTAALSAGIAFATGEFIVTMDGDLQNDAADIPMLYQTIRSTDVDMVTGFRANRKDDFLWRKLPSQIANFLIRNLTKVNVHDYGCSLRIMKSEIAKDLRLYGDMHRFIPILANMQGAKIIEVKVHHHARRHGKSKYGIERTLKVISDLIYLLFVQRFNSKPMHFYGSIGLATFVSGMAIFSYLIFEKITGADIGGRPLTLFSILLIIAGLQMLSIGIISEFLTRILYQSDHSSPYKIRNVFVAGVKTKKKKIEGI